MLKVTINYSELNESFRIGYFLKALGMERTENCFWTEIYMGKNPDEKYVYAVINYEPKKPATPISEWQGKIMEFMGISVINNPNAKDFKGRYAVALVSENVITHIEKDGLSKAFDLWHKVKKYDSHVSVAVLNKSGQNIKESDKVTLYTVDYNGVGFSTVGRRFFTSLEDAKEFAKMPLRDNPIKRTYTYTHAKQIIEEQDELDVLAQRWCYLPDYE